MNANLEQIRRIRRCYRFVSRHRSALEIETVARTWITRYAGQWRDRHGGA